jgi:hypothetical protein
MGKTIILAKRPDLVLKLEKYNLIPQGKKGGIYEGSAKRWAKEGTPPYDKAEYRALAERLPTGWEELTREEMNELLAKLQDAIGKKKKAKLDLPNKGSEKMLKTMAEVAFLGISTAATLLVETGIGILPDRSEKEKSIAKEFSFDLVLHLINGTDFLTKVFRTLAATMNTSSENQELIAEILKVTAFFLAIAAASNGNEDKMKKLVQSFRPVLLNGVATLEQFASKRLNEEAIRGDKAEKSAMRLQQARIALEREDFDGFYEAFTGALGMLNITPDDFLDDVKEIYIFGKKLRQLIVAGLNDESNQITQMSQAM